MDGGNVSDNDSVSHVSDSLPSSEGEVFMESPTCDELDEICRNLPPYYDIMEFNEVIEPSPIVEEEDVDLYPPEEMTYRSTNWKDACLWTASESMFEKVAYNVTPYFLPILNLGKDIEGKWRLSDWDGDDVVECDNIRDIFKLSPREGCTRDQMRVEYVKGWVSNVTDGGNVKGLYATFRLYDGTRTIRVSLHNDTSTHKAISTGVLRDGCVVVLYHVVVFINANPPPGVCSHRLSAGFSNVLEYFG